MSSILTWGTKKCYHLVEEVYNIHFLFKKGIKLIGRILFFWLFLSSLAFANPNAVCFIRSEPSDDGSGGSSGSGFFINENQILTAYHVVKNSADGERRMRVEYRDGIYNAKIIKYDLKKDLALLEVENIINKNFLDIDDTSPTKGDVLYNLGHPRGKWQVHKSVGSFDSSTNMKNSNGLDSVCYVSKAMVRMGMSGGPCINKKTGKVVGLLILKHIKFNIAYNTSSPEIAAFLKKEVDVEKK